MAGRGRSSFQKRQKEQVRLERRQQKAARKEDRKANKGNESDLLEPGPEMGFPEDTDDLSLESGLLSPNHRLPE